MRIIIAGSRDFYNYAYLEKEVLNVLKVLRNAYPNTKKEDIEIISGHAKGADQLGEKFAKKFNVKLKIFYPNWSLYDVSAGYIRNKEMAEYASLDERAFLIAFHINHSKGTQHMIDLARNKGLKVFVVNKSWRDTKGEQYEKQD